MFEYKYANLRRLHAWVSKHSSILRSATASTSTDGLSAKSGLGSGTTPAHLVALDAFIQGIHPKKSALAVGGRGSGASGSRDTGDSPGRLLAIAEPMRKRSKADAPHEAQTKVQKITKDAEGIMDSLTATLTSLQERGFTGESTRTVKGAVDLCEQIRGHLDELKEMSMIEGNEEAENQDSTA